MFIMVNVGKYAIQYYMDPKGMNWNRLIFPDFRSQWLELNYIQENETERCLFSIGVVVA